MLLQNAKLVPSFRMRPRHLLYRLEYWEVALYHLYSWDRQLLCWSSFYSEEIWQLTMCLHQIYINWVHTYIVRLDKALLMTFSIAVSSYPIPTLTSLYIALNKYFPYLLWFHFLKTLINFFTITFIFLFFETKKLLQKLLNNHTWHQNPDRVCALSAGNGQL